MKSAESILSAFATKKATKSRTPSVVWNDPKVAKELEVFRKHKEAEKDAKAAKELVAARIKPLAIEYWLKVNRNVPTPVDRLEFDGGSVSFADAYGTSEPSQAVIDMLPKDLLRTAIEIKIDGDLIPSHLSDKFAAELIKLCEKHGVTNAVEVSVKRRPALDFAIKRHSVLTPEQNLDFESRGLGTRITIK